MIIFLITIYAIFFVFSHSVFMRIKILFIYTAQKRMFNNITDLSARVIKKGVEGLYSNKDNANISFWLNILN